MSDWRLLRWTPDDCAFFVSVSLSISVVFSLTPKALNSQNPGELPPRLGFVSPRLVGASPRLLGLVMLFPWADVPATSGR